MTDAALDAAMSLLEEVGYAQLTVDAVARRAGIGKPAIYRRYANKAELVAAAIARVMPSMAADAGPDADVRATLRTLVERAAPVDPQRYAALLGGLIAERRKHPELIRAYRASVLGPRRATVRRAVELGRRQGRIRASVDPEFAVDTLGGAFVARTFAGLPVDAAWREGFFAQWWAAIAEPEPDN